MIYDLGYGSYTITTEDRSGCLDISSIDDDCWYLNRLYVQPKQRNKGLATSMMKELISLADLKSKDILLEINPYGDLNYDQLKIFYEKFGFNKIGYNLFERTYKEVK